MKKKFLIPLILAGVLLVSMIVAIVVITSKGDSSKQTRQIEITSDLSKLYDGTQVSLPTNGYTVTGDGEVKIDYKNAYSGSYSSIAPKDAGDYIVRVSVDATSKWKSAVAYKLFTISKIKLTNINVTSKTIGANRQKVTSVLLNDANILDGDEVYVVLTTKQNWQDGSEYKLLLNDATGVQYEIASLSGKQGGNYELVAIRGVVGTLKINNKTLLTTSTTSEDYNVSFNTILSSDRQLTTIKSEEANNLYNYLLSDNLKDKLVTISVFNSNEEDKIELARIKRFGTSFLGYSYTGGTCDNRNKTLSFELISKLENYTDNNGYWIFNGESTTVYVSILVEPFVATDLTLSGDENEDRASSPYTSIYLANQPKYYIITLKNSRNYVIETFTYSSVGDNKIKKNIANISIFTIDGTKINGANTNTLEFTNTGESTYYIVVTPYSNYNSNDGITLQLRWKL